MLINALSSVDRPFKETRNVAITFTTLLGLLLVVLSDNLLVILYLILFSCGLAAGLFLFLRYTSPPSVWIFQHIFKLRYNPYHINSASSGNTSQCPVCDKPQCQRHEVYLKSNKTWKGIQLSPAVDVKIEEFCQLLMIHYINSWYHPISKNSDFLHDVRSIFRHVAGSIVRILLHLDIGQIVTNKLIPLGVSQLEKYAQIKHKYPEICDPNQLAEMTLQQTGLHYAVTNDTNENRYLQSLVEHIIPYLLPDSRLSAPKANSLVREIISVKVVRSMLHLLAKPDMVNHLILMLLDPNSMTEHSDPPREPRVELLTGELGINWDVNKMFYL